MTASTLAIIDNEIFNFFINVGTPDILDVPSGFLGIISAGLILDYISKRYPDLVMKTKLNIYELIKSLKDIYLNLENY